MTEQNAQAVYREGERMMVWVLAALAIVFVGIGLSIVGGPAAIVNGVGIAGMLASVIAGLIRLSQAE